MKFYPNTTQWHLHEENQIQQLLICHSSLEELIDNSQGSRWDILPDRKGTSGRILWRSLQFHLANVLAFYCMDRIPPGPCTRCPVPVSIACVVHALSLLRSDGSSNSQHKIHLVIFFFLSKVTFEHMKAGTWIWDQIKFTQWSKRESKIIKLKVNLW